MVRDRFAFSVLFAIAILVGCDGDSQSDSAGKDVSLQKTSSDVALEREKYIRENITRIAESSFPDKVGLTWQIHRFEHRGIITFAEVEPQPSTVGYPRFKFVVSFMNPKEPLLAACYAFDKGRWTLLFTDPQFTLPLPQNM